MRLGSVTGLSPWGDLVWGNARRALYRERLHPSPSERISYGSRFEESLKGMPPDRIALVNERIDGLARHLESPAGANLRRLDLKPLKGNPRPPSTHEIDAWAGRDAHRIFGHWMADRFMLDALDAALH